MFEPVHGTAPGIFGKGIANPMATMFSAAMMLDHLGHPAAAADLNRALREVLAARTAVTPDLGGTGTTRGVTAAVIERLRA